MNVSYLSTKEIIFELIRRVGDNSMGVQMVQPEVWQQLYSVVEPLRARQQTTPFPPLEK